MAIFIMNIPDREETIHPFFEVSPIPMRIPVVNGMDSVPASRSMRIRTTVLIGCGGNGPCRVGVSGD
jgi:hypothetical protein